MSDDRFIRFVRTAEFIAALAAWPIALYVAGEHFPDLVQPIAMWSLVFIIGCAVVLRSLTIVGALIGYVAGTWIYAPPTGSIGNVEVAMVAPLLGALVGSICQAARTLLKRGDPNRSEWWIGRAAPIIAVAILAVASHFLASPIFWHFRGP